MKISLQFTSLVLVLILQGCAAAFVPVTSDPMEKIEWAEELYYNQSRPLPAERLLIEAIEICTKSNDSLCLGYAYLSYANFFSSSSVEKWEKTYRENGFWNKNATYENRHSLSRDYFKKAISKFKETKKYDALTNTYLRLGSNYHYFTTAQEKKCAAFDKSVEYNLMNIKTNPAADVYLPNGYSSYKEYIAFIKKEAGCI